jgi:Flp pilus assembly secretin CpaC
MPVYRAKVRPVGSAAALLLGGSGCCRPFRQRDAANVRPSTSTNSQRIKLGLNKSIVIDLPSDAYDILVANPAVADAVTRTARRIYLFGKAVGETNIFVFGRTASRSPASTWRSSATWPVSRTISSASSRTPTSRSNCSTTTSC